jgi:hypothetical protein
VRLQETPGRENEFWQQSDQYREQGYNIMTVEGGGGWPKVKTQWACPPGQMPREAQAQSLRAEF